MIPSLNTPGLTREQKIVIIVRTLWWAVKPLFAYITIPGLCIMIGMAVRGWTGTLDEFVIASGNFYTTLGIFLTLVYFWHREKRRGKDLFTEVTLEWRTPDYKKILRYALIGIELSVFLSAVLSMFPEDLGMIEAYIAASEERFQRTDLFLILFSLVVIAPLSEEIIFRGYMLSRLLTQFSEKTAIIMSAVIFALCHTDPIWIVYALIMGLFLAKVSILEDNIFYSLVLHAGFNLPSVIIIFLQMFGWTDNLFFENKILILFYGIIALLGILIWLQQLRGKKE